MNQWFLLITFLVTSIVSFYLLSSKSMEAKRRATGGAPTGPINRADMMLRQMIPSRLRGKLDEKLEIAGNPRGLRAGSFIMLHTIFLALWLVMYSLTREIATNTLPELLYFVICLTNGILLPYAWISRRGRNRQNEIEKGMPDFLDMLDILVGLGLSFATATERTLKYMPKGALRQELRRVVNEMKMGKSFEDSMRAFSTRMRMPILSSFVSSVIQAYKLGVDISEVIQAQADSIRVHRRQRAEEAAAKAATKMILPMMLCALPLLFIILLGPVIINALSLVR